MNATISIQQIVDKFREEAKNLNLSTSHLTAEQIVRNITSSYEDYGLEKFIDRLKREQGK